MNVALEAMRREILIHIEEKKKRTSIYTHIYILT